MNNPPRITGKIKPSQLIKWHRRAGLAAALLVLILALSGIALNHTMELRLDKRPIDAALILDWYDIELPDAARHFRAGEVMVSQLGDQLFLDGQPALRSSDPLTGAAADPMFIAVALRHELLLFTPQGELVERIDPPAQIGGIDSIGTTTAQRIAIRDGDTVLLADAELLGWHPATVPQQIDWSIAAQPGDAFDDTLMAQYRSHDLTYERLLLDLHSGRLFGSWGIYVMDAAALLLILLAATGVWRWWQQRNKSSHR